ncbi:hypothetical protein [Mucilaginibacter lappiensis]|uniref:Uncharacterized protein n=1 Tax=Mucilaginibacter lappiensis TaxID=354630 RepID=A0A841J632_9SPHI|nr:hypothetical protein [Mucilaginibacter lappiensis]MBB6126659.1 hypothetical protein [Mucilaginibacter lappiensis]
MLQILIVTIKIFPQLNTYKPLQIAGVLFFKNSDGRAIIDNNRLGCHYRKITANAMVEKMNKISPMMAEVASERY